MAGNEQRRGAPTHQRRRLREQDLAPVVVLTFSHIKNRAERKGTGRRTVKDEGADIGLGAKQGRPWRRAGLPEVVQVAQGEVQRDRARRSKVVEVLDAGRLDPVGSGGWGSGMRPEMRG